MRRRLILVVAILVFSACVSSSVGRRRTRRPPTGFGRQSEYQQNQYGQEQDFGDIGQSQDYQRSNNPLEYGGLQQSNQLHYDDDQGDIQQVSQDTEDFSGLTEEGLLQQNQIGGDEPPPRYTQGDESSEVITLKTRPEAVTPKGEFVGLKQTVNGVVVYAFYGIPFAKPPTGDLRFRRPEPADKLTDSFDASHLPNACPQTVADIFNNFRGEQMWVPNTNVSEDCLYLNIWVPASVFELKEEELVPVIFWIFGGGYFSGSGSLDVYNGAVIAATQGLVVVNAQYRLGPLGFLYFGTEDAPGNMGLIDQSLSLRWLRENIEYFGGDPNAVTVAGESCGAASVGFHLVSPLSKSYFKRGVMTSGLPNSEYALKSPDELKARSIQLAKLAGCKSKDTKEVIECLRKVDAETLVALQWKLYKNMLDFPFSPTVDGYFLTDHPDNLIKNGKAKRAELILGTVQDEGTYFILYHYLTYFSHLKPTSVPYDRFVDILNELFHDHSEIEREAIVDAYTNWENPEDGYANQKLIGEAVADSVFVCPHRKFADEWANRGLSVYYYHFTERLRSNPWPKWMGVMHGDDIPLFFGEAVTNSTTLYTEPEKQMSLKFMNMIANFARVGVPSNKWERYTSEHPVYLNVNATTVTDTSTPDLHGPRSKECVFWNKVLPTIRSATQQCNNQLPPNQFGSLRQPQEQPQVPQWNPNGQGIHGGQGFHQPSQQQPHCGTPYPQTPAYYPPPPPPSQQYRASNGCNPPPAAPTPTAQSCECTVREGVTSTTRYEQDVDDLSTPPPAVY